MAKHSPALQREIDRFMAWVVEENPHQPEFHQAVEEVVQSVMPAVLDREDYRKFEVLHRLVEPDRIVSFRVAFINDENEVEVHRAWRVQFSQALGPYKGGFRLHPSVNESVLKFLGFEQTFKNSLTGLSLGGAKGGANFDPKGRSDTEVMRFCRALMTELHRHLGPDTDIPAGDVGVGAREIGYLFGASKRLSNTFTGVFTGKGLAFGGSRLRTEATGYGAVHFGCLMLNERGEGMEGKRAIVSGSGNVALYAMERLEGMGARAVTASDSHGFVHDPEGIVKERLAWLVDLKEKRRGRVREYAERFPSATFHEGKKPWGIEADMALPCATENELDAEDAKELAEGGVLVVVEGANMPCTASAVEALDQAGVAFGPGKAANAGGVAVSGLEMSQNSVRERWPRDEVDRRLAGIMNEIHAQCAEHGKREDGTIDYVKGANLASFYRVAEAMLAYGVD